MRGMALGVVQDRHIRDILPELAEWVQLGAICYIKWTCPKCGERVLSEDPNVFCDRGYLHSEKQDGSECGFVYFGDQFGLAVVIPDLELDKALAMVDRLPPQDRERATILLQRARGKDADPRLG